MSESQEEKDTRSRENKLVDKQLESYDNTIKLNDELLEMSRTAWNQANQYWGDAAGYKQQADAAMIDYKNNLNAAITKSNNLNNQADKRLQDAASNLAQRGQAAIQDAYGSSTQDYFNRTQQAGNQQGNLFGTSMGAQANVAAQDASRQAGLSKSAAAMVGAGKGAEAATAGYLTGFTGGQSAYQDSANSRFDANLNANKNDYLAQTDVAQGMRDTGKNQVTNADTTRNVAQGYMNQQANSIAQGTGAAGIALGNEGGHVTANGIFNLDRIRYKGETHGNKPSNTK